MNSLFHSAQNTAGSQMTPGQIISMVRNSGKTPEEFVKDMLNNGSLSKEQFERYRIIANQTLGMNI